MVPWWVLVHCGGCLEEMSLKYQSRGCQNWVAWERRKNPIELYWPSRFSCTQTWDAISAGIFRGSVYEFHDSIGKSPNKISTHIVDKWTYQARTIHSYLYHSASPLKYPSICEAKLFVFLVQQITLHIHACSSKLLLSSSNEVTIFIHMHVLV
jgi:hypothetical protein